MEDLRQRTSASRVIVDLTKTGLEAQEQGKKQFFELADGLVAETPAIGGCFCCIRIRA